MSIETEIFAKRLKSIMEERHLASVDVVNGTGISSPQISNYLSGGYKPSRKNLDKMAAFFDVSQGYLLGFENEPTNYEGASIKGNKPTERDVKVALFGGDEDVTDEEWEEVLSFVDYIRTKRKKTEEDQ